MNAEQQIQVSSELARLELSIIETEIDEISREWAELTIWDQWDTTEIAAQYEEACEIGAELAYNYLFSTVGNGAFVDAPTA